MKPLFSNKEASLLAFAWTDGRIAYRGCTCWIVVPSDSIQDTERSEAKKYQNQYIEGFHRAT